MIYSAASEQFRSPNPNPMNTPTQQAPESIYLDWFNNYLTVAAFASAYGITESRATDLINLGRAEHESAARARAKEGGQS